MPRAVERGKSTEAEAAEIRGRVTPVGSVEELAGVDLAIEVVPEIVDLKAKLLADLAKLPGEPILASNTSSISIATLADRSGAPERVLGLHFFNPPTAMPLVELVATPRTDREAVGRARMLAQSLGKQVVDVLDGPGFLVNRCARPFYAESLRMVEDGFAEPWEIDRVCVELGGFPLGPFELMDVVGVDVGLAVTKSMWEQSFGEPRWRPSPIQVAQVAAGRLGRKTGGGFYDDGDSWRSTPVSLLAAMIETRADHPWRAGPEIDEVDHAGPRDRDFQRLRGKPAAGQHGGVFDRREQKPLSRLAAALRSPG